MKKKTIRLCGKDIDLIYCAASEQGFESLSGKSINDLDFTLSADIMKLSLACIIAAYSVNNQNPPIDSKELLYDATPQELTDLYLTVINLRAEWYNIPAVVANELKKEADQMTDTEKEEAEKNVPAPTSDTAAS